LGTQFSWPIAWPSLGQITHNLRRWGRDYAGRGQRQPGCRIAGPFWRRNWGRHNLNSLRARQAHGQPIGLSGTRRGRDNACVQFGCSKQRVPTYIVLRRWGYGTGSHRWYLPAGRYTLCRYRPRSLRLVGKEICYSCFGLREVQFWGVQHFFPQHIATNHANRLCTVKRMQTASPAHLASRGPAIVLGSW
jgi:hypothetical protein